ncbi:hypothetical protein EOS93_07260 [Rhizobium sp. RMa-01]|uniref:hypothetical protein n=1 Tax=unclassified Rhizobium TaxID=2613769 RepID=UPI000FE09463|nr:MULTISPECIES: hypothetical protein [unclassified Rhizobium]RVU12457.1 hypothetical protein EOS93_07260 [Rhizobium sp. RMa-01]
MRAPVLMTFLMLLSGCDTNTIRNGPNLTPVTVRTYMDEACRVPSGTKSYSAYDFYVAGIGAARLQCDNYMLSLINANRDSRFAASAIASANAQTALILAATMSNATKPLAVVAATSEFVRQIIIGYGNEYAFASFAQEIYPQTRSLMNAYLADSRTIQVVARIQADPNSIASYCIAADLVRTFASNCSPLNIDSNVRRAISSATPTEVDQGSEEDAQARSLPLPGRPHASSLALPTLTLGR